MIIREMKTEEIPAVQALLKACKLYWPEDDTADNLRAKRVRDGDLMLVALVNDEIVGFVMASHDGWSRIIWHLGVLPKFRKNGIAKHLGEEIVRRLNARGGTKMLYGFVSTKNRPMLRIMKKFGFKKFPKVWVVGKEI